jgi:hypothetical protein
MSHQVRDYWLAVLVGGGALSGSTLGVVWLTGLNGWFGILAAAFATAFLAESWYVKRHDDKVGRRVVIGSLGLGVSLAAALFTTVFVMLIWGHWAAGTAVLGWFALTVPAWLGSVVARDLYKNHGGLRRGFDVLPKRSAEKQPPELNEID